MVLLIKYHNLSKMSIVILFKFASESGKSLFPMHVYFNSKCSFYLRWPLLGPFSGKLELMYISYSLKINNFLWNHQPICRPS